MMANDDLRTRPEYAWIAAALPATAHRLRVRDPALAATLREAGADVNGAEPDVDIGPARGVAGDAELAIVPLAAVGTLHGPRLMRLARRLGTAVVVRARASLARRVLRRRGYPDVEVWPWDVEQALRLPCLGSRSLRVVERLPRAAVVVGRRGDVAPSLLDTVAREASRNTGEPIEPGWPQVTASGTLLVFTGANVLRVAIGPGRRDLERHMAALAQLRALDPPLPIAERLPRPGPSGAVGLAGWLIEGRLPGSVPAVVDGELLDECVEFLVALHACARADQGHALAPAADVVASLAGAPHDALVRLAHHLDGELSGLPRGFGHGDFWRKNMLVDGSQLRGVADWERAGPGRLPLLDLIQLTVTQAPFDDRGLGVTVAHRLLPWARAGGTAVAQRYCERVGFEPTQRVLRALVLAFWLDRLARELEKCGDKGGTPGWRSRNVDPVLAALANEER